MLLCQDEADAKHALKLATQAREPYPWYQHEEIGYNYRMSNICAGIGRGQMKILTDRIIKKRAINRKYKESLNGLPIIFQPTAEYTSSNCWLTSFILDKDCKITPAEIIDTLAKENIESRHLWKPMHAQPVYAGAKYVCMDDTSVSDTLFMRGICLPSDTKLSDAEIEYVCKIIRSVF